MAGEFKKVFTLPGERNQAIFTPPEILDPIRALWRGIALDPCGHVDAITDAEDTYMLGERSGLIEPWLDRTYCNPPYNDLKSWLAKAYAERGRGRIMCLIPVRPHRKWWRDYASTVDAICWLGPVKFVGYTQVFPAPLCLTYSAPGKALPPYSFRDLFSHLGSVTGPLVSL